MFMFCLMSYQEKRGEYRLHNLGERISLFWKQIIVNGIDYDITVIDLIWRDSWAQIECHNI